jgi:16S rRNA (cytidine1402-2'-O)-methyltransferase
VDSGLYVVATPLGNLGDITARALEVLGQVALIAAEDTRHTRRLCQHFGIETPLTAYHDHSGEEVVQRLVERILAGDAVALVTDAGTPLVSDPGYRLVRAVQDAGAPVIPVPGACAAMAALSCAGLPSDRFLFLGFPSAKSAQRRGLFESLLREPGTLVFYEAPHRLMATLEDMVAVFGEAREAVLARELTKQFETIRRAPLGRLSDFVAADPDQTRGEMVVLVSGFREESAASEVDPALLRLLEAMAAEMPARRAAALLADYAGLKTNQLYRLLHRAD